MVYVVKKTMDLEETTQGFAYRLCDALDEAGLSDPDDVVRKLEELGFSMSNSAVRKHRYGAEFPRGRALVGYSIITGRSTDWLLFGKIPPHPSIETFRRMIEVAAEEAGLPEEKQSVYVSMILDILNTKTQEEDQKTLLAMIEAYVSQKERSA